VIDRAALKRLASAVRFRPWPPRLTFPLSYTYEQIRVSSDSQEMPPWSPLGVQTRYGCVRGIHGDHVVVDDFHAKPLPLSRVVSMVAMLTIFVGVSRLRRQRAISYTCVPRPHALSFPRGPDPGESRLTARVRIPIFGDGRILENGSAVSRVEEGSPTRWAKTHPPGR
jgi:hypothetical protein